MDVRERAIGHRVLGDFTVTSGAIIAADPGNMLPDPDGSLDTDLIVKFKAKNGVWLADVAEIPEGAWRRVASLTIRHADYSKADPEVLVEGEVGVDIAMAGFFDADAAVKEGQYFRAVYAAAADVSAKELKRRLSEIETSHSHYDAYTAEVEAPAGTSHGITCSSGYGDGSYRCYVARDGDEVVAAKIVFIDETT